MWYPITLPVKENYWWDFKSKQENVFFFILIVRWFNEKVIIWFVVFYFSLWLLFAVIYYLDAGGEYSSFEEGYSYGTEAGTKFIEIGGRIFIIIISLVLAGILTYKGKLPGTKDKTAISSDDKSINENIQP